MDALLLSASEASLGQHTLALRVVLAAALAFSAAIVPAPVTATAAEQQQTRTIRVGYLLDNQGFESSSPDTYMSGWATSISKTSATTRRASITMTRSGTSSLTR